MFFVIQMCVQGLIVFMSFLVLNVVVYNLQVIKQGIHSLQPKASLVICPQIVYNSMFLCCGTICNLHIFSQATHSMQA